MKINHPTIKDYTLGLESLIGPENALFYRGRISGKNEISLPSYWEELIIPSSVTVHLTHIGANQNIIVKRVGENKVFLQSCNGMPIDCYYLVIAEIKDASKIEVEQSVDSDT